MKFKNYNQTIPQDKRKEINEKILYLIDNKLCEQNNITPEIVYNSYTGDGGLHGLNFKDFDNFHSFTEAKKEIENGQFFTGHNICKFVMNILKPSEIDLIADLTGGIGNFINFTPVEDNFYMNELDIKAYKVAKYLYPKANIENNDIRAYNPNIKFDLVVGNPPFNIKLGDYISQYYYCLKSYELLKAGGLMCIVVPNSFLNDEFMDKNLIISMNKMFNFVLQFNLPSTAFKSVGVENFETKVMIFQKKNELLEEVPYSFNKLDNIELTSECASNIYMQYIKPLYDKKQKLKNQLLLNEVQNSNDEEKEFQYKVKKMLFDIKRNPKIKKYYGKCETYYQSYYSQKKPENMDYEEWTKKRVTKNKVIAYLKHYLNKQHNTERDVIKLVKTNYGVKLKPYSSKMQKQLSKFNYIKEMSFNDMVVKDIYPFEDKKYYNLYLKKKKEYLKQNKNFKEMKESENIKQWLENTSLKNYNTDEIIKLNDIQKYDTNLALQKKYSLIQWECGCGKSVTALFQMLYRLQFDNIYNCFVVAPAIAINNTWEDILQAYKLDYIRINNLKDISNIKKGQIVIVTFNMVIKYNKFIKKYIKQHNQNIMTVIDESDNICSLNSKRYKTTLNCFRRTKYKLCTTGTSTRNNIGEIYSQLEFLYNNSINLLSKCEYIYKADKRTKELKEESNKKYMCPIPPYKQGYNLFTASHIPEKISVFGIKQYNQDIYNSEILKEIIDKTIITRTFKEVVGKKIYDISQVTCSFTYAEKELYSQIINEFYTMMNKYFCSTGNSKKDSMLRIIRQMNLMIKACSIPQTFYEYKGDTGSKFYKVDKIIKNHNQERVCIGCKFIKTVNEYYNFIKSNNPNRPIFIITGESTTLNQRKEIIKQLEKTKDGILICTQQSLSSSMNINFVNTVILPELDWNDAKMRQFYFRFIRFNSTDKKNVIFVTYKNSIESNMLQLVISKEKLNYFMKDKEIDNEDLWEEYGIDFDILNMLMYKEKDTEGNIKIRWGEQEIN